MKFYDMPDKTAEAGGPGFETIAVREVQVPHPLDARQSVSAYEVELELDVAETAQLMAGGRLRICLMSHRIIPIYASVVSSGGAGGSFEDAESDPTDPVRPIVCNCGKPRAASEVSWGHGVAYCDECIPH